MNCKYCRANCTGAKHDREIALCLGYDPPKTNGDFIRSMSDEELATKLYLFICVHVFDSKVKCEDNGCKKCWLDWLKECAE